LREARRDVVVVKIDGGSIHFYLGREAAITALVAG